MIIIAHQNNKWTVGLDVRLMKQMPTERRRLASPHTLGTEIRGPAW